MTETKLAGIVLGTAGIAAVVGVAATRPNANRSPAVSA
jgi:hypothetical protein